MNVVFDFGAVLFNWQPDQLISRHFPALADSPEQLRQMARNIFSHEDWQNFDRGVVTVEDVITRTASRLDLHEPALTRLIASIPDHLIPIEQSLALLIQLVQRRQQQSDVRLYYLSNMPEPIARVLQQRHEFLQGFDGGIFSGDVKLIKPDPGIYAMLENRFSLEPVDTVFIDDLQANIDVAKSRGWQGIHFQSPQQAEVALAAVFSSQVGTKSP